MEKVKKLKRYSRKDYSQVVDFPVEIVGRDGVVRRYSFEASVRLYQRRIASAPSRYRDTEVVTAEVRHCRLRIEQLRKSYFQRYGWAALQVADSPGAMAGQYAGEVVAFLRRFFGEVLDPNALAVNWVQDLDQAQVYFVRHIGHDDEKYLLYLYQFRHHGACEGRERFFDLLRTLRAVSGDVVEALVAFHHTADCGLVLTGQGGSPGRAMWPNLQDDSDEGDPPSDVTELPLDDMMDSDRVAEGVRLLTDGEPEHALQRFEQALSEAPFRRTAAVAVAALGDVLGQPGTSEMAARVGLHYSPDDPVLRYHLGLALVRQDDLDPARAELERAVNLRGELFPAHYLRAMLGVRRRDRQLLRQALAAAERCARPEDAHLLPSLYRLRWLGYGELGLAASSALALVVALGALGLGFGSIFPALLGLSALLAAFALVCNRLLSRITGPGALRRLRLAPPEAVGSRGARLDDFRV